MIFIDSSAFIALTVETDEFHQKAINFWKINKESVVTTNFVVSETLGWIRYVAGKERAIEMGKKLLESTDLTIHLVNQEEYKEAWKLFQKLPGKGISFVDCTSFASMSSLKIINAFTFDQDFKKARFKVFPS